MGRRKRTLEDPDSGGVVVDATSSLQSSGEDLNGGNEIVGEAVVEITLDGRTVTCQQRCLIWRQGAADGPVLSANGSFADYGEGN